MGSSQPEAGPATRSSLGRRLRDLIGRTFGRIDCALVWTGTNIWVYVRILWSVLVVCRASVIMVIAGGLLLASEQGQDVLLALAQSVGSEQGPFWHGYKLLVVALLSLSFWMISTWYWALTMLRFDLSRWTPALFEGSQRTWAMFLVWATPTVLGLAAISAFAFNLAPDIRGLSAVARSGFLRLEIGAGVLAVLFVLYERFHRSWLHICEKKLRRQQISDIWGKTIGRFAGQGVIATWVLLVTAAIGTIMLVGSWAAPVGVGRHFRTDVLFFVWAGSMIPMLALLAYFTEHCRIPVMTILVGLAVLFSASNDNHVVRYLERDAANVDARPTVEKAAQEWLASTATQSVPGWKPPLIIVATAGGGSRAAYWTATVLGRLQDCYPEFARHTFAISGVSGGSLGAAAFRAVLSDLPTADANKAAPGCGPQAAVAIEGGVAEKAQAVVGSDFLTATIATMLYPDLLQRFLWWPIKSADRTRAIELAWEDSYRRAMAIRPEAGDGRFAGSFINAAIPGPGLADGDASAKRWPALFLNATWVETGRRLVISPYRLPQQQVGDGNDAFPVAHDLLALLGRDIPLSTAASLSARFPYVLPAGTIVDQSGRVQGRAVDGGYFENYGAVTALELLAELRKAVGPTQFAMLQPIVIQISSDPSLPDDFAALCNVDVKRCMVEPIEFGPELRSPIRTFMQTRQSRGVLAAANLKATIEGLGGEFIHFRLCPANELENPKIREGRRNAELELAADSKGIDPPLGWALSTYAKNVIRGMLPPYEQPASSCLEVNQRSWTKSHEILISSDRKVSVRGDGGN